ncbi:hypothetical protein GYMLUDRAFT_554448 [Collybiopsis luxurians FD-317 M1]|uniref:Uncharacterized protein n=1 Tax=Collybiopsis luxurians FD-317 M1 TaxID=944289 RepID=A0A0D0C2C5_9AGAR|nr:hypothetical protein GYMLUDRAFT_554448 [Collybiopsis luxurians FD-317 M1]
MSLSPALTSSQAVVLTTAKLCAASSTTLAESLLSAVTLSNSDHGSTKFLILTAYLPRSLEIVIYFPSKAKMPAMTLAIVVM